MDKILRCATRCKDGKKHIIEITPTEPMHPSNLDYAMSEARAAIMEEMKDTKTILFLVPKFETRMNIDPQTS